VSRIETRKWITDNRHLMIATVLMAYCLDIYNQDWKSTPSTYFWDWKKIYLNNDKNSSIIFKFLAPQMKHSKQKLMRIIYNNGLIFVRNNIYKYNRNLYLFTYRSCLCFLLLCFFLSRRLSLSELSSLKKIYNNIK
jgi:hypothetical protein